MSFYNRYLHACNRANIKPCSQTAADMLGVTKSTISIWDKKNTTPNGATVARIAQALDVTSDYLLGLSDGPDSKILTDASAISTMYNKLDRHDQIQLEGIIQGMLLNPKYN